MSEEVCALVRGELVEQVCDDAPEFIDGPRGGFSEQGLELGERKFDGVQIRGIGRQVEQECAGHLYRFTHAGNLVAGQIVHHHDVAGAQGGRQHLLYIGLEGGAVHGAVQDHGGGEAGCPQAGDEGGGLPVPPGYCGIQALAFQAASPKPGHIGLGPGFINKDKPFRPQPVLPIAPVMALTRHIGAFLFRRVHGFLYR